MSAINTGDSADQRTAGSLHRDGWASLLPRCRKCEAIAVANNLCAHHYCEVLEKFEADSKKVNLNVGAGMPNAGAMRPARKDATE